MSGFRQQSALSYGIVMFVSLLFHLLAPAVQAATPGQGAGVASTGRSLLNPQTGLQRFLGFPAAIRPVIDTDPRARASGDVTELARRALTRHGKGFGVHDARAQLRHVRTQMSPQGFQAVRFRQLVSGIPVFGADVTVNMDNRKRLSSISARLVPEVSRAGMSTSTPVIDAADALQVARDAIARTSAVAPRQLQEESRELVFYRPDLIGESGSTLSLAWNFVLRHPSAPAVRQRIFIDALTGRTLLSFSLLHGAKRRVTSNAGQTGGVPGTTVCDENDGDACSRGVLPDADAAHAHAGDFHDFMSSVHGRDSIDGLGEILRSTVLYFVPEECPNAFWDGIQVVYCEGVPQADDVVAHEFTHGFTERTSDLIYRNVSGAINESLSDIWGEFTDLVNGTGNDHPAWRWIVGEDSSLGPIRNMADPGEFGDPDSTRSPRYYLGSGDSGGVHINSGVSNRTAVLLVDGGELDGVVVQPLDANSRRSLEKAAALLYEVQLRLLPSSADWVDLANGLRQACIDLQGTRGFTAADCVTVDNAIEATGLDLGAPEVPEIVVELCPADLEPSYLLSEEFTNGIDDWTAYTEQEALPWLTSFDNPGGVATAVRVYGSSAPGTSVLLQNTGMPLPPQSRLHVTHLYRAELLADGAVIDLVDENGTDINIDSLSDAGDAPYFYIDSPTSPIVDRQAFTGELPRFVSSRYDLGTLEGTSPRLRFRFASDEGTTSEGWWLDAVRLYNCRTASGNYPPTVMAGTNVGVAGGSRVTLQGSVSDPDGSVASFQWSQSSGPAITLEQADTLAPSFTAPVVQDLQRYTFVLTATDNEGVSNTGRVVIRVEPDNYRPQVFAGGNRSVLAGKTVELSGQADDREDGLDLPVNWTQLSGPTVSLSSPNDLNTTFSAPLVADTAVLVFRLSAVDSGGARADSDVNVIVRPAAGSGDGGSGNPGGGNQLVRFESGGRAGAALSAFTLVLTMAGAWCLHAARRRETRKTYSALKS